jgi:glycogen debranching enzyme
MVLRRRYVGQGMREDVTLRNFGEKPARCRLELVVDGDFADLFEVKAGRIHKQGELSRYRDGNRLVFSYRRGAFRRSTQVIFSPPVELSDDVAVFDVVVPRRGEWSTCVQFTLGLDELVLRPRYVCGEPIERSMPSLRLQQWRRRLPVFTVEDSDVARLLSRSTEDLAALRIFDPQHPDRAVVAAGAPWFMTLFGRDSLITSWAAMLVDPDLALGTLQTLAQFQGTSVDARTEEEPGRILHEVRFGETAQLSLGGGQIYYGTADATPLFVMLLGELGRWGTLAPRSTRCCRRPTARWRGSMSSETVMVTATSSTSEPPTGAWRTRDGRTRGTRSSSPMGSLRAHRSRSARSRRMCTRR